jgi:hypothetical protein
LRTAPSLGNSFVEKSTQLVVVERWETFRRGKPVVEVVGLTANVLKRVVRIGVSGGSGTAFTVDVDGGQYLITAKHVVAIIKETNSTVQVWDDGGKCENIPVTVLRCSDPVEIAVLVPKKLLPDQPWCQNTV